MKHIIQKFLKQKGLQISRYPGNDLKRRIQIVTYYGIDTILDIGANVGTYALQMRNLGYNNKIVSFEPLKKEFQDLEKKSQKDNNWWSYNYGLGESDKIAEINIAANSYSSSILDMLDMHSSNAPESKYIEKQTIEIKTLDGVFHDVCKESKNIMLKIDTQGYEKNVLEGAKESLQKIVALQLEMSLVPLYKNEILFLQMINELDTLGFELHSLENDGFADRKTGKLLQTDGIFVNKKLIKE